LGFSGTMAGGTLGPLVIAEYTEHVLHDSARVGMAMLVMTVPCLLLAASLLWWTRGALARSLAAHSSLAQVMEADRP
jgi:hypothetical protein